MSSGYSPADSLYISDVTILGLDQPPSKVSLNGAELPGFDWDWNNNTMVSVTGTFESLSN